MILIDEAICDFATWFTGMSKQKVVSAFNEYKSQSYIPETEEEAKEFNQMALHDAKYELPADPIETAKTLMQKKDREIKLLKDEISRLVYLSEQPGGYHP